MNVLGFVFDGVGSSCRMCKIQGAKTMNNCLTMVSTSTDSESKHRKKPFRQRVEIAVHYAHQSAQINNNIYIQDCTKYRPLYHFRVSNSLKNMSKQIISKQSKLLVGNIENCTTAPVPPNLRPQSKKTEQSNWFTHANQDLFQYFFGVQLNGLLCLYVRDFAGLFLPSINLSMCVWLESARRNSVSTSGRCVCNGKLKIRFGVCVLCHNKLIYNSACMCAVPCRKCVFHRIAMRRTCAGWCRWPCHIHINLYREQFARIASCYDCIPFMTPVGSSAD